MFAIAKFLVRDFLCSPVSHSLVEMVEVLLLVSAVFWLATSAETGYSCHRETFRRNGR